MESSIPPSAYRRVVIIGAGFGGLALARRLSHGSFQVVLVDRHNYHQFQPLFYQVATSGLAPSAIAFPVRKVLHGTAQVHFRVCEVQRINSERAVIETDHGELRFDDLVMATGADTNFYGLENLRRHALPMKSIGESLAIRNSILEHFERALSAATPEEAAEFMNVVVVGGGPTGVELAGAVAEMRTYVLPKDYPELDFSRMRIVLLEASPRLLETMSTKSSAVAERFLKKMKVEVLTGTRALDYDGSTVSLAGREPLKARTLIWAAGVRGNLLPGLDKAQVVGNGRLVCDQFMRVQGYQNIYAVGDMACLSEAGFEKGHPQVAQVAMQQANTLAKNFLGRETPKPFHYRDLGSMATVGRSKATIDLPFWHFHGFVAWLFWLFVHLMNILGVKNKAYVFADWLWYYISFDQNLRLVIKQKKEPTE